MARPRVIIESRHAAAATALSSALDEAGLDPLVCTGPDRNSGCPVFDGAPCALIEDADAVVYDLDLDRPDDRVVLQSLVAKQDGLPIVTERSSDEVRAHGDVLRGVTVVVPFSPRHTAEAVVGALVDARSAMRP